MRKLALVLAGSFAVFACQKVENRDSAQVILSVLMEPDGSGVWGDVFRRFEEENPGIRINHVEGPASTDAREDLYVNALLSGSADYDLVYADIIWIPKFAAAGWLEDLGPYWDEWESFVPATVAGATYNGKIFRVPVQLNGGLLYCRRDWLNENGLTAPATFEELRESASRLQDPVEGRWGFVWQGKQYEGLVCNFVEILSGFGGYWIDPETSAVGLDSPEAVEALTFLVSTVGTISPPGVTTYAEEESRLLFEAGDAAFLRNWPYVFKLIAAEKPDFLDDVEIVPMPASSQGRSAATLGGAGFAIAKSSPNKEAAWKLIEFVTSPEIVKLLNERIGLQPARISFYQETEDPIQKELYKVLSKAIPRPQIPQYAQASDILQRQLSAALTGQASPKDALAIAARETRLLLDRP